jgi:hypothetical protein
MAQKRTPSLAQARADVVEVCDPPPVKRQRLKLRTPRHVADELARVYRSMKSGTLRPEVGTKLVYTLSQLSRVLEVAELADRIERLEAVNYVADMPLDQLKRLIIEGRMRETALEDAAVDVAVLAQPDETESPSVALPVHSGT